MKILNLHTIIICASCFFTLLKSTAQQLPIISSSDNCGCGLIVYMGISYKDGWTQNSAIKSSMRTFLETLDFQTYKMLRERNRGGSADVSGLFTPFNEAGIDVNDDIKEEEFEQRKRSTINQEYMDTSEQSNDEFWSTYSTLNNSSNYVACIKACSGNKVSIDHNIDKTGKIITLSYFRNDSGVCPVDEFLISNFKNVKNKRYVKKVIRNLKRNGFESNLTFTVELKRPAPLTLTVNGSEGCKLDYFVPMKVNEDDIIVVPKPDFPYLNLDINLNGWDGIMHDPEPSTIDPNQIAKTKIISSGLGNNGGYTIESNDRNVRANGAVYFYKTFKLPITLNDPNSGNYNTLTFDFGQGTLLERDGGTGLKMDLALLQKRFPESININLGKFWCKWYLGNKSSNYRSVFINENSEVQYGIKGSNRNNPKTMPFREFTITTDKNVNEITCICWFNDPRKDSFYEIAVPKSSLIISNK